MLTPSNKIVNALWIGNELSRLELLTIHSFLNHGHDFQLWTYDKINTPLPAGVVLKNAAEIIPAEKIFRYKNANQFGHGKNSLAGFSDLFRYKLLYEKGGWWVDMDVTCLKPFEISEPYFFRKHHDLAAVGNVMKCEPKSDLMKCCYEEALVTIDENNTDWLKPITILNKQINALSLHEFIYSGSSNNDCWPEVKKLVYKNEPLPSNYSFVHWMNEEWRSRNIDKQDIRFNSTLGKLLSEYNLLQKPNSSIAVFRNDLKHLAKYFFD